MDVVASAQTPSPAPNGVADSPFVTIDPQRVVDHLVTLLGAALGAKHDELEAPGSLLAKDRIADTIQRCNRFANDNQPFLYIRKDLASSPDLENGDADSRKWTYKPGDDLVKAPVLSSL